MTDPTKVAMIAEVTYVANLIYRERLGDHSGVPWEYATQGARSSTLANVREAIAAKADPVQAGVQNQGHRLFLAIVQALS